METVYKETVWRLYTMRLYGDCIQGDCMETVYNGATLSVFTRPHSLGPHLQQDRGAHRPCHPARTPQPRRCRTCK
jgi:hypothetical protein